jgi:hypothetical protein
VIKPKPENSEETSPIVDDRRTMERYWLKEVKITLWVNTITCKDNNLVDISFNSIRLITTGSLREEQNVTIGIQVPYKKELSLKGYVLRVEEFSETKGHYMIAIKFHPFSTYDRFNSLDDRKTLKQILDKALKI